ncbi:MAG: hypothetical protein EOM37_04595 [Proteobacteria bacterium]|jgi:hypothetical protein|nr:hypothetical protein [Pseudomonadota bacterium]
MIPQYINSFYYFQLTLSDIPEILNLQQKTYDSLLPKKKQDMILKSPEQLAKLINTHGFMIGTKQNMKDHNLIAYSAAKLVLEKDDLTEMRISSIFGDKKTSDKCCILQTDVTNAAFQNKGIHKTMTAQRVLIGQQLGKSHFLSEVAVDNPASIKGFTSQGFHVIAAHPSPIDECKVLIFYNNTNKEPIWDHLPHMWVSLSAVEHFASLPHLIQQGFKSSGIEKCGNTQGGYLMFFKKPFDFAVQETAPSLPIAQQQSTTKPAHIL